MTPEALAALSKRAYRHMTPWSAESFAQTLAMPHSLLVTEKAAAETGHLDGFVLGQVIAGEAEILALACDPDVQRSGVASRALARFHAAAVACDAERVFLEAAAGNAPARAFYEHHGYAQVGTRRGYYGQPDGSRDDALILSRALP